MQGRIPSCILIAAALAPVGTVPTEGLRSCLHARAVLDAGVEAMGGLDALRAVKSVRRRLSGSWTNPFQGRRPYPGRGPSLTPPPAIFSDTFLSFIDYAGDRWLEELDESDSSGDRIVQLDV